METRKYFVFFAVRLLKVVLFQYNKLTKQNISVLDASANLMWYLSWYFCFYILYFHMLKLMQCNQIRTKKCFRCILFAWLQFKMNLDIYIVFFYRRFSYRTSCIIMRWQNVSDSVVLASFSTKNSMSHIRFLMCSHSSTEWIHFMNIQLMEQLDLKKMCGRYDTANIKMCFFFSMSRPFNQPRLAKQNYKISCVYGIDETLPHTLKTCHCWSYLYRLKWL